MPTASTTTLVSFEDVTTGIKRVWAAFFGARTSLPLEGKATLREQAEEMQRAIVSRLLDAHPLTPIVRAALLDVVGHAEAFDLLAPRETALVHARQVEETAAVIQYLIAGAGRYNEFRWRWDAFPSAHGIRNRHFNLKQPLAPEMEKWIVENAEKLKAYFKISGAPRVDDKPWKAYSNWLYKIPIKDIFEKTGREGSYSFTTYDWGSHSTHFSPMGDRYERFELGERGYVDAWRDFIEFEIHSFFRILLPLVSDQNAVRGVHAAMIVKTMFDLLQADPARARRLVGTSERLQVMVAEFVREPPDVQRLEHVLLGAQPEDPLLIKLGSK